jgi:hypothetical protein
MEAKLDMVLEQVARDKNIDKSVIVGALEQAILTAAKRQFGENRDMEAKYNPETGSVDLFLIINVVAASRPSWATSCCSTSSTGPRTPRRPASRTRTLRRHPPALKSQRSSFGRIAAQTAKQVITQRIREAERDKIFNEFKDRKGELITGIVRRFERGNIIVDLGRAEAVLPVREQVPRESYRVGDRIQAYVLDVQRNAKGPADRPLAHLAGACSSSSSRWRCPRSTRASSASRPPPASRAPRQDRRVEPRPDVDPVGACVGMKGSRVQAVVQELRGEKIDIVQYSTRIRRVSSATRSRRPRCRGPHRRGQLHDGAHRRRRPAQPGHRPPWPERAPGQRSSRAGRSTSTPRARSASSRRRRDDMRREAERRASLSGEAQLLEIGGIDEEILPILKSANVHSPEDLIRTPIDQVANVTGIDMSDLAKLRQRVMSWLAEVSN